MFDIDAFKARLAYAYSLKDQDQRSKTATVIAWLFLILFGFLTRNAGTTMVYHLFALFNLNDGGNPSRLYGLEYLEHFGFYLLILFILTTTVLFIIKGIGRTPSQYFNHHGIAKGLLFLALFLGVTLILYLLIFAIVGAIIYLVIGAAVIFAIFSGLAESADRSIAREKERKRVERVEIHHHHHDRW